MRWHVRGEQRTIWPPQDGADLPPPLHREVAQPVKYGVLAVLMDVK